MSSVILNEHQILAVYDFLMSDKHGLILWWNMGTGKTLAALSAVINFPDKDVVIICPEYIKFVWKNEMKKIYKIKNKIKFYNYDNLEDFIKINITNSIVIIDEAHNLVDKYKEYKISDSIMIEHLNSCYKILLLTGTPFNNDISESVKLINIAAGTKVVPYNFNEFRNKYYEIDKKKVLIRGYLIEIISKSFFLIFGLSKSIQNMFVRVPLIILCCTIWTLSGFIKYDINEYKKLKSKKFLEDVRDYINYYDNTYYDKINFPKVNVHTKFIEYEYHQVEVWYTLSQNVLPVEYIKKLNIASYKDIEYYSEQLNIDDYLKKGVLIGNLPSDNDYPKKFYEILKIAMGKRAVFYSTSIVGGMKLFKNFLNSMKQKYLFLDDNIDSNEKVKILDAFKNNTIFLLLHPIYVEGITICGAEQLHIIEPLLSFSKTKQLMGRVARYRTHTHLPESKRVVDIYQWSCRCAQNISKFSNLLKKQFLKGYSWLKYRSEVYYTLSGSKFTQDLTPDSLLLIKTGELFRIMDDISEYFYKYSSLTNVQCCITYPSNKQQKNCEQTMKPCSKIKKKQKLFSKKNKKIYS